MKDTFQVHVKKDPWDKSSVELSITHNGYQFSTIGALQADEINVIIKALQEYKRSNKACSGCVAGCAFFGRLTVPHTANANR